jgi:predicted  nucleic acid-binding Zn-ribbon protein
VNPLYNDKHVNHQIINFDQAQSYLHSCLKKHYFEKITSFADIKESFSVIQKQIDDLKKKILDYHEKLNGLNVLLDNSNIDSLKNDLNSIELLFFNFDIFDTTKFLNDKNLFL